MSEIGDADETGITQPLNAQLVRDELTVACSNLGSLDANDGTYMKDRDCKPCLREISRYLSADSKRHEARLFLGGLNVVKTDMIPLLCQYCDFNDGDSDLFTLVLRLCTNLTSSVLLLFENQEVPTEGEQLQLYRDLLHHLFRYKEAFASNENIWSVLNVHLRHCDDDEIKFERLIVLIRNILHIPVDSTSDFGRFNDFDAHQMCLHQMEKAGLMSTLIQIASETQKGTEYCFHLMECFYLMLRDQNPKTIATAKSSSSKRTLDEDDADRKLLRELSERDKRKRAADKKQSYNNIAFKYTAFVVQNCKSISENGLILSKPIKSMSSVNLDAHKTMLRRAKNRRPLTSETPMDSSDKNKRSTRISYSLKMFCKMFVEKVYNNYMQQIKHNLIQKKGQADDESYYLWAIQFYTCFNRHLYLNIDNISETLSTSTLHFIQVLISGYQDKIKLEKKKFGDISKRLHLAVRAYREILSMIQAIDLDKNSEFSSKVESIKANLFGEIEYTSLLVTLFQQYDEPKHSLHYVKDLIETNDIFIELYDAFSKTHNPIEDNNEDDDLDPKSMKRNKKRQKRDRDMKTAHFLTRYCCPDVVSTYLRILKDFATNEDATNLAIAKFFERIVYDCKYDLILCQISVFRCLFLIMDYHSPFAGKDKLIELAKHLMETFGAMANKKRWMFQELLFWKTMNDTIEIENAIDPPPVESTILPQDNLDEPPDLEMNSQDEIMESPREGLEELLRELGDSDLDSSNNDNDDHDDVEIHESVTDLLDKLKDQIE